MKGLIRSQKKKRRVIHRRTPAQRSKRAGTANGRGLPLIAKPRSDPTSPARLPGRELRNKLAP